MDYGDSNRQRAKGQAVFRACVLAFFLLAALGPASCDLFSGEKDKKTEATELFDQARELAGSRKYVEAAKLMGRASQLDPKNGEIVLQHGILLAQSGQLGYAVMELSRVEELLPGRHEADWHLGLAYQELGKLNSAIQHMEKALENDRGNLLILKKLIELYIQARSFDLAERNIKKLKRRSKGDVEIVTLEADMLLGQGKDRQALVALHKAARETPDNSHIRLTLGRHLMKSGQDEAAAKEFEEALRINGRHTTVMVELGHALLKLGRTDDAIRQLVKASRLDSGDVNALVGLGRVYLIKGQHSAALDALDKAITLRPRYVPAHLAMGEIYARTGDGHNAVRCLKRATEIDPTSPGPRLRMGQLLKQLERFLDAINELETSLRYSPNHSRTKRLLAELYVETNRNLPIALRYVDEQLNTEGLDLEMLKLKTRILLMTKRFDQALKVADQALEISPQDEDLLHLQARVRDARRTNFRTRPKRKPKVPEIIRLNP